MWKEIIANLTTEDKYIAMKVVVPNKDEPKSSNRLNLPIPYERPEIPEFKKGDGQTYRLRNDPANDKSPGYDISVRYFSGGSCEEFLLFETNMKRVFKGQGVTAGPGRFDIARRLFTGAALTTFNQALGEGNENLENFKSCLNAVRESIFPRHACVLQKRIMKGGHMRKPRGVTMQQFADRVMELNSYLSRFPPISATRVATEFPPEEIVDILESAIPTSWKSQMKIQGYMPHEHDAKTFIEKCTNFEEAEAADGKPIGKKEKDTPKSNGKGKGKREYDETKRGGGKKTGHSNGKEFVNGVRMCPIHNYSHPMQDCKTLLHQAKNMKGMWDAAGPEGRRNLKAKHEINALDDFDTKVAKAVKAELAKARKRVKFEKEREDINAFEHLTLSESDDDRVLSDFAFESDSE